MKVEKFTRMGVIVAKENTTCDKIYIIKEGVASLVRGNVEERKIYKGESFGLNSLYYNTMRRMTVRA
jgi:cGMP-dependent protein kinase